MPASESILDGAADTTDRAQRIRGVVERGELEQALSLLMVAEDAYYKWRRVREGIALLANTLRDPELITSEARRLERWNDSLC